MQTTLVATMLQSRMRPVDGTVEFYHGLFRDRLSSVSCGKEVGESVSCVLGGSWALPLLLSICFHRPFSSVPHRLAGVACTASEVVMQRMMVMALSMVYVGGLYCMLTYHNKDKPAMITRLFIMALNAATALLLSVVFIGNLKYVRRL